MSKELVLVTGGSGFVGSYVIVQLLNEGYNVRTTVRNVNKKDHLISMLKKAGATNTDQLSFVEADLTKDDGWTDATKDCQYVMHVASPMPSQHDAGDGDAIIRPAVDGTLRVLKAAKVCVRVLITSHY